MRFQKSLRNSVVTLGGQLVNLAVGFLVRMVFIRCLGKDYLGVNGVMESMLTLLSVTELGIGTSITFALYGPIERGDREKIGILMGFFRRTYHVIGFVTLAAGLALIPFMQYFTQDAADVPHLLLIYLLFLGNTVLSYFFSYKRTLISAYQDHYINSLNQDLFGLLKHCLQIVVMLVWRSYIGYLLIALVCVLLSNVFISRYCDRKYDFLKQYRRSRLPQEDKALMKRSVISLIYQKVGAALVTGTDNLMISRVGIAELGVYSNYSMVISTINVLIYNVLRSINGSIGNLMVQNDTAHKYRVYREFVFTNFCLFSVLAAGIAACMQRFIVMFAGGSDWLLDKSILAIVVLNFYLNGMRQPNVMVIEAAALFNRLRPKTVAEVLVNLIVSILFLVVFRMGIYGVLLGTTVSMVSVCIWWEAWAVHKYAFGCSPARFALRYMEYLLTAAVACGAAWWINTLVSLEGIAGFIVCGLLGAGIAGALIVLLFGRTEEFRRLLARFTSRSWRGEKEDGQHDS